MKKTYCQPISRMIRMESEHMIATSQLKIGETAGTQQLSNSKEPGNAWDSSQWSLDETE